MNRSWRFGCQLIILMMLWMVSADTVCAQLTIQNVFPTDVTPSEFSVVWQSSAPAAPLIAIYSDATAAQEITTRFEITSYPLKSGDPTIIESYYRDENMESLREISKSLGIMKVRVHGCSPDTDYFIRVGADDGQGQVVWWPESGTYQLKTMSMNLFIGESKQVLVNLLNNAGDLSADGWVVMMYNSETLYPVSTFTGDGTGPNQAFFNLDQLFGLDGLNWIPQGIHDITVNVTNGSDSYIRTFALDFTGDFSVASLWTIIINIDGPQDGDNDGLSDSLENRSESCTNSLDADTDDDGLADGVEDANQNGMVDPGETDPCNPDTDGDGIQDGTEVGITDPVPDPDGDGPAIGTDPNVFISDSNPSTTTNPLLSDTDLDGIDDGIEDGNQNGSIDPWETEPADILSVPEFILNLRKGYNLVSLHQTGDLKNWMPVLGDIAKIEKVMAYDQSIGRYISLIPDSAVNPGFTLMGTEGIVVYAKIDKKIGFASAVCPDADLSAGINLIGFGCPSSGYSAFDLLNTLGKSNIISIQKFSTENGMFQSAGFNELGNVVGIDFLIVAGEGYLIYMKQAVDGFKP